MEDRLRTYLTTHRPRMFALLKKMVCINSGSHNKIGVDAVGRVVTDALAGCGLAVTVIAEEAIGNHLVVRTPCPSTDTGGVLLAGHMDTVFPADTAFTDYREPMNGLIGQLAARQPQVALPRRLPMDWPSMATN